MTRYRHSRPNVVASTYEVTAAGGGGGCAGPTALHALPQHQGMHYDTRRRKSHHLFSDIYEMTSCETPVAPPHVTHHTLMNTRKRKSSSTSPSSTNDDEGTDESRSSRTLPDKKQNHSEIEKRRRDKMNTYITELSSMVPMCGAIARKLDKLTVLRMAVQHLRSVRGTLSAGPLTAQPRPSFLSERELNSLVLHAARDSFLLVVSCDRGRLLYVSNSVTRMLQYNKLELLGQSLFDILHPKDVAKVKEQLSSSDLGPRERLIDAKTMTPLKPDVATGTSRLCPGARRSFFCRIKCRAPGEASSASSVKEEAEPTVKMHKKQGHDRKYCVVQCTGYLKSWAPAEMYEGGSGESAEEDGCSMSCLVAVGRALPDLIPQPIVPPLPTEPENPPVRYVEYVSRHAPDGKFLFVDQRVTLALGYLPQELLGTSLYEYVGGPQLGAVARTHKSSLLKRAALRSPVYSHRRKDGSYARIVTHFKPFRNPWTKDVECLVANNTLMPDELPDTSLDIYLYPKGGDCSLESESASSLGSAGSCGALLAECAADEEMQRLIDSQVESHKIGATIAEEALRSHSDYSPDLPTELLQDSIFTHQVCAELLELEQDLFTI